MHAAQLLSALSQLRLNPALCDVHLQAEAAAGEVAGEAGGEAVAEVGGEAGAEAADVAHGGGAWAHRAVLAASSPYFRSLFTTIDERTNVVKIKNVDPEALLAVLDYIYSPSSLSVTVENARPLLSAATSLDVGCMRDDICKFLQRALAPNNALGLRAIAEIYNCPTLAAAAFTYIDNYFEFVLQADQLLALSPDALANLLDSLREPAEEHVLDAVLRWTQYRVQERQCHLFELLQHVRMSLLPPSVMAEMAHYEPLASAETRVQRLIIEALCHNIRPDRNELYASSERYRPRRPNSALLVVGGWNVNGYSRNVLAYDLSAGCWNHGSAMSGPRGGAGVASVDGRVYVVGGDDGDGHGEHVGIPAMERGHNDLGRRCLNSVSVYDVATGTWSEGPSMNTARRFVNVAVLDGILYVAGGWDPTGTVVSSAEALDPREGIWRPIASMSTARASLGLAALDGELYAVGGYNSRAALNTVERYNPTAGSWEPVENMSEQRWGAGVGVLGDALYVVGGCNGSKPLRSVEFYCTGLGWKPAPSMITARYDATVTSHAGRLYAVGGRGEHEDILSSVEMFNPPMAAWQELPTSMPEGHTEAAAVVVHWPPPYCENVQDLGEGDF